MLRVKNLSKSFQTDTGPLHVLRGVNLDIPPGETVALLGESGSGKSTLLHICAGLEPFHEGSVTLADTELSGQSADRLSALRRDKLALVFQQFNLIPSLTVADNIAFQARLAGRNDAAWNQHLAQNLGLSAVLDRYPEQISGGQQQRVAIGRALAVRPPMVFADEPTGNLDEATGDGVLDLLLALARDTGAAVLMVTHSERLAARLSRSVRLRAGEIQ